jgi:hypothetical protein
VAYLLDEDGNYITDEDGNKIILEDTFVASGGFLLSEDGDFILTEDGDKIMLEDYVGSPVVPAPTKKINNGLLLGVY